MALCMNKLISCQEWEAFEAESTDKDSWLMKNMQIQDAGSQQSLIGEVPLPVSQAHRPLV